MSRGILATFCWNASIWTWDGGIKPINLLKYVMSYKVTVWYFDGFFFAHKSIKLITWPESCGTFQYSVDTKYIVCTMVLCTIPHRVLLLYGTVCRMYNIVTTLGVSGVTGGRSDCVTLTGGGYSFPIGGTWFPVVLRFGNVRSLILKCHQPTMLPTSQLNYLQAVLVEKFSYRGSQKNKCNVGV